jgi:hypothetical protein
MVKGLALCVWVCVVCVWASEGERGEERGKLLLAAVLTRHGDRTPVRVFPNTLSQWPEVDCVWKRRKRRIEDELNQKREGFENASTMCACEMRGV